MAGRPRKHSTNVEGHRTKKELEDKKEQEQKAGDFKELNLNAPVWIAQNAMAKREYERVAPMLAKMNVTELDVTALAMYAISFSKYIEAMMDVDKHGIFAYFIDEETGKEVKMTSKKNPALAVMNDMSKEIRAYASSLGMTLDSRTKLIKLPDEKESDKNDVFAALGGVE